MSLNAKKKLLTVYYDWASPPSRAVIAFTKFAKLEGVEYEEVRIANQ